MNTQRNDQPYFISDVRKVPIADRREAYLALMGEGHYQDSLQSRISADLDLTPEEIAAVLAVIGRRARRNTVDALRAKLAHCPHLSSCGLFGRLLITDQGRLEAQYVAGQDYTAEIPRLRKLILAS